MAVVDRGELLALADQVGGDDARVGDGRAAAAWSCLPRLRELASRARDQIGVVQSGAQQVVGLAQGGGDQATSRVLGGDQAGQDAGPDVGGSEGQGNAHGSARHRGPKVLVRRLERGIQQIAEGIHF